MSTAQHHSAEGLHQDLVLAGDGESMLRLEKRMHCAMAGLGLKLPFSVQRDPANFGLGHADTPAVLLGGKVVFAGLPRTETLEDWLREIMVAGSASIHVPDSVTASQEVATDRNKT